MKVSRDYQLSEKAVEIWRNIRYEKKFRSLDMSDQMFLIMRLDRALKGLKEIDHPEYHTINAEWIYSNLGERGYSRANKIYRYFDDLELKVISLKIEDEDSRNKLLEMMR